MMSIKLARGFLINKSTSTITFYILIASYNPSYYIFVKQPNILALPSNSFCLVTLLHTHLLIDKCVLLYRHTHIVFIVVRINLLHKLVENRYLEQGYTIIRTLFLHRKKIHKNSK